MARGRKGWKGKGKNSEGKETEGKGGKEPEAAASLTCNPVHTPGSNERFAIHRN
jgi:hypothetical protein